MYLSLTLVLGNIFAVVPPVMLSDRVVVEQSLDIGGDRSTEFKISQQPQVIPATSASPITKELTFQEEIDKKISIANKYRAQKNFKRESEVLTGIGYYYLFFGAPRKGLPYIESSLKAAQNINDPVLQCFALNALGDSYKALGEYQKAQESYRRSIATFQKVTKIKGNTSILLQAMYGIAAINENIGETKAEFKYLIEALKISRESGDVQLQSTALRIIRTHYFKRK
jgi:tetratricopeptide (TPR) repeat protein